MGTSDSRTLHDSLAEQLAPVAVRLRGSYSVVRPVSQVTLELRREHSADVFVIARDAVINWVRLRAGRPLPPQASKGEAFELEDVGSQRTAAVSIDQPRYWAVRLDDSDKEVAQRSWVTEVGIAERTDNTVVLGVRLLCVTRGEDSPFKPSIPRFVRTIIERCANVFLEGRKLDLVPWPIQSEEDVETLVALIENQSRRLDVIVCALPEGSEDPATATVDVCQLHMGTLGAAHVAVITGPASFHLSDRVGKEFSVFRGAVRTYRSGFNIAQDEPFRHPLSLSNRIIEWPGGGRATYEHFLIGQTLMRSASGQLESWCHDYLSGAVEVHNRAIQGAKKSRFEDYTLIYKALLLLRDAYVPMKRDGGLDKKVIFDDECKKLGLSDEPTFTGVRWGEEGDTYLVRYAGRRCLLDRHLKKGTSKDERYCFRLYFFWDDESEQVVVGWLPSHLDTRIT